MNVLYPETTSAASTSPDGGEASRVSLASRRYRIVMALLPLVALLILAAIPAMAEPEPKCSTPTVKGGPACWIEIENQPGCFLWNPNPQTDELVTWSGSCHGGLLDGHGTIRWSFDDGESSNTGTYVDGKENGVWSVKQANGIEDKGPYVDGKKNGVWVIKQPDGITWTQTWADGERHGEVAGYRFGKCLERQIYVYGHMTEARPC